MALTRSRFGVDHSSPAIADDPRTRGSLTPEQLAAARAALGAAAPFQAPWQPVRQREDRRPLTPDELLQLRAGLPPDLHAGSAR